LSSVLFWLGLFGYSRSRFSGRRSGHHPPSPETKRSTADAWCSEARSEHRTIIWTVPYPGSSAAVRRSTWAMTSLPANVRRLQCQVSTYSLSHEVACLVRGRILRHRKSKRRQVEIDEQWDFLTKYDGRERRLQ
jgi:hypothetical protein